MYLTQSLLYTVGRLSVNPKMHPSPHEASIEEEEENDSYNYDNDLTDNSNNAGGDDENMGGDDCSFSCYSAVSLLAFICEQCLFSSSLVEISRWIWICQ